MNLSRKMQALVSLIAQEPPSDEPYPLDTSEMPADLAALLGALAAHEPPTTLGMWEFGLLDEDEARHLLEMGGDENLAGEYEHFLCIGQLNDEVHLVVGWSPEKATVLEIDPEYGNVDDEGPPDLWLDGFYGELEEEDRLPLRQVYTLLEAPEGDALETVDPDAFEAARKRAPDTALEADGHLYFAVADDGRAISVHDKGLRYLDAAGQARTVSIENQVRYGGIAPEGDAAYFLELPRGHAPSPLHRVALPSGVHTRYELRGVYAFAVVRDGRVVLRKDCELVLCRVGPEGLEEITSLVSLDLGSSGVIQPAFGGRGVVVSDGDTGQAWILAVDDDGFRPLWRLDDSVSGEPHVAANVVDVDQDHVLVRTRRFDGRIVRVPRTG